MSRLALLTAAALAVALTACGPKRIPGTDIRDTSDTRAIVALIDQYRAAAEKRDAQAVLGLVSERYYDDAGTADPSDDQDYAQLAKRLPADYAKLSSVRLSMGVKSIDVKDGTATADILYDGYWRVETPSGEVAKTANDVNRMKFVRENGVWRIAAGL